MEETDLTWHDSTVSREKRQQLMGHRGCVAWFTGLSGSGKSTVANLVDASLHAGGVHSFLLDGDNVRHGLTASPQILAARGEDFANRFGLGFSPQDREENIRRVGAAAELFASAGLVTLVALVSPYRKDRDAVRQKIGEQLGPESFLEIFMDTPLEICEERDPKGLYRKARAGELVRMTGIDDPYEDPLKPEIHLRGAEFSATELADQVVQELLQRIGREP
jgi:adenylylsulfate kinase